MEKLEVEVMAMVINGVWSPLGRKGVKSPLGMVTLPMAIATTKGVKGLAKVLLRRGEAFWSDDQ